MLHMRKYKVGAWILALILAVAPVVWAEEADQEVEVDVVAGIVFAASDSLSLSLGVDDQTAGADFVGSSATSNIYYSTIVGEGQRLKVEVSAEGIPVGLLLKILSGSFNIPGNPSNGICGVGPNNDLTLSDAAQDLITGIGTCVTGTDAGVSFTIEVSAGPRPKCGVNSPPGR